MKITVDRRRFLGSTAAAAAGFGLSGLAGSRLLADQSAEGAPHAEKLGWHLGCQGWTFKNFTFVEGVAKTKSLGLKYFEMYPRQKFSAEEPDVQTGVGMSPDAQQEAKKVLGDAGVCLVNYGVCPLGGSEAECRKTFEFAKAMGIQTLVSEPAFEDLDMVERLADEYEINVALHNHPKPSRYWDPDTVLEHCKGRSKRLGSCADTGHWARSGIVPVEAIKKLEGRIISFHFKDINEFGERKAHDVPWGTGVCDAAAMLAEIHRQKFQGVFSIEYEYNWDNSIPEIAKSIAFFDKTASQLA